MEDKNRGRRFWEWALCAALALLSAWALASQRLIPPSGMTEAITGEGASLLFRALARLRLIAPSGAAGSLLFALLLWGYHKVYFDLRRRPTVGGCLLSVFFALCSLARASMEHCGNLILFWADGLQVLIALVTVLGSAVFYHAVLSLAKYAVESANARAALPVRRGAVAEWLTGGGVLGGAAVALLCWLPYLIAYFPGSLSWDATNQLNMFFGVETWYNNHPPVSTVIMGSCVSLGRLLGSDSLGLFLYTLLQSAVLALGVGYSLSFLRRRGAGFWWRAAALAFFALVPLWGFYAQWVVKDTLYIGVSLIFSVLIMDCAMDGEKGVTNKRLWALFALGILCCLLRKNGVGLAVISLAALSLAVRGRGYKLKTLAVTAGVLVLYLSFNSLLVPALGIGGESGSDLVSAQLQQTARFVSLHPEEVTAEERSAIENVLKDGGYELLAEKYTPNLSDPVKNLYDNSVGGGEVRAYLAAWLRMGARRPGVYLESFVANTYAYYCPEASRAGLFFFGDFIESNPAVNFGNMDIAYLTGSDGERALFKNVSELASTLPGVWLCYSQGAFTWLLLALAVYVLQRKKPRLIAGMAPALATLIMCLLSSVNGELRYFMPVIAAAPVMLYAALGRDDKEEIK